MEGIVPELSWRDKERIKDYVRRCRETKLKTRYLVIVNLLNGRTVPQTIAALQVSRSMVYAVAKRFRERGRAGLVDGRCENGKRKLDDGYLGKLHEVTAKTPQDFGWPRPTWTRELLVKTLANETGVEIHVSTMSTALQLIGARCGRAKPTVGCPWPTAEKNRRLQEIQTLIDTLPDDEVLVYEDEVDIHLNPKIGMDWMVRGQQKTVTTPGQNEKRYIAGALDAATGECIWVEGEKKNSTLFVYLLWELVQRYRDAKVIHVILDNYVIHSTEVVEVSLDSEEGQRLQLHFLPPYCPDHNRIERLWRELHANVTRNHTCETIDELMAAVKHWLNSRARRTNAACAA